MSGALASFPSPGGAGSIVNGPDGNVWFTEVANINGLTTVDRITPDGHISEVAALPANSLTTGPDGNVWYAGSRILDEATDTSEGVVGRIGSSGDATEFVVPNTSFASEITAGQDGKLWFTASQSSPLGASSTFVGCVTLDGQITEFPLPTQGYFQPSGITADGQGNLWVGGQSGTIFRVTTSGQVSEYPLPKIRVPASFGVSAFEDPPSVDNMTTGPDGNVWLTGSYGDGPEVVMRVTPSGRVTRFTALPASVQGEVVSQIIPGPRGNLFFSVVGQELGLPQPGPLHEIGEITTSGHVSFLRFPKSVNPSGVLTVDSSGTLWFSTYTRIDRFRLPRSHPRGHAGLTV